MATYPDHGADDDSWLIDIKQEIVDLKSLSTGYTICRVPDKLRIDKTDPYSPLTISIGPLHNPKDKPKESLKAMEEHKLSYMLSLFERTDDETGALDDCGHATSALDKRIRDCYEEKLKHTKTKLARMLLLDGCFILELFVRYYTNDRRPDDPILLNPRMISVVRRDLALLENQIPFFVLERLFQVIRNCSDHVDLPNLVDLARCFFELDRLTSQGRKHFHLLDLIHNCYSPSSQSEHLSRKGAWKLIQSATKLSEAGIEFAGIEHETDQEKNLFDLEFKNGLLRIPQLCIESSLFQNLIAMEQCLHNHEHYMTSYGLFMDYLVDTSKDVEFLVKKKILPHNFGDCGPVADLFNNICKQTVVRGFYFAGLCEQVNEYYESKWHVYRKSLIRDYFGNPWMVTSVIAAFVLLVLTLLQTLYSVLSYYNS